MLATENLHRRSNLRSIPDDCFPQDAITTYVYSRSDTGLGVSEKRAEGYAARQGTLRKSQVIVRNAKIVTDCAGNQSAGMREQGVESLHPAKSRQCRQGQRDREEHPNQTSLEQFPDHKCIAAGCGRSKQNRSLSIYPTAYTNEPAGANLKVRRRPKPTSPLQKDFSNTKRSVPPQFRRARKKKTLLGKRLKTG